MFMPDGNGQPQVAVLKVQDSETRGVLDGSEIVYMIYTRYLRLQVAMRLTIHRAIPFVSRAFSRSSFL